MMFLVTEGARDRKAYLSEIGGLYAGCRPRYADELLGAIETAYCLAELRRREKRPREESAQESNNPLIVEVCVRSTKNPNGDIQYRWRLVEEQMRVEVEVK